MKIKKILLSLLWLQFLLVSCKKDFLEVADKTVLLKEAYVTDLTTTKQFLNGVYVNMANSSGGSPTIDGVSLSYFELIGDNLKPGPFAYPNDIDIYNWRQVNSDASSADYKVIYWSTAYACIQYCNFVISKAEEFASENNQKANEIKGEALALRAYLYFNLVNVFAQSYNFTANASHPGVPYIINEKAVDKVSRNTVSENYQSMISDLNTSLTLLPKTGYVKTRMNYYTVAALLSRIYLFKQDYIRSISYAREVFAAIPLMTENYPTNLYRASETEAIFHMLPGNSSTDGYIIQTNAYLQQSQYTARYAPSQDIINLLKEVPDDKRRNWVGITDGMSLVTKYPIGATGTIGNTFRDHYQVLFRSTEMYLNAAESYAQLSKTDSAHYFLDLIKKRAIPSSVPSSTTGNQLIDEIYKERRKELAFDGFRMMDLLRWKKSVMRSDAATTEGMTLPYPSNKAIAPIPQRDVELLGLQQNQGY